jgi:hypothetical protein
MKMKNKPESTHTSIDNARHALVDMNMDLSMKRRLVMMGMMRSI